MITVETNFGPATISVTQSGKEVLVTLAIGRWPPQRVTIAAEPADQLGTQIKDAAYLAQFTALQQQQGGAR